MNWTKKNPKVPGWYWVRLFSCTPGLVEQVFRSSKGLYAIDEQGKKDYDLDGYWWAGPIPEPTPEPSQGNEKGSEA